MKKIFNERDEQRAEEKEDVDRSDFQKEGETGQFSCRTVLFFFTKKKCLRYIRQAGR